MNVLGAATQPILTSDLETRDWVSVEPFACPLGDCLLVIPAGTHSDLASIPRFMTWAINIHELGLRAPLVHDFLYRNGGIPLPGCCTPHRSFTRKEADLWLKELARQDGVPAWKRRAAYLAVRIGGAGSWRGAR